MVAKNASNKQDIWKIEGLKYQGSIVNHCTVFQFTSSNQLGRQKQKVGTSTFDCFYSGSHPPASLLLQSTPATLFFAVLSLSLTGSCAPNVWGISIIWVFM